MPDVLSYADAVRLLGGERSRFVDTLDKLLGGALLAASGPVPALLGLFDAKAEFVRLGNDLVRQLTEKRSGLSRYGRTQRLAAAHAVIAVTAFFEALDDVDLPFAVADLEIDRTEQLALAGAGPADPRAVVGQLLALPAVVPGLHLPYPEFRKHLLQNYLALAARIGQHVGGLAAWARLGPAHQDAFQAALGHLPDRAVRRHRDLLTALAVDFPEVAYWSGLHEHEATRSELRQVAAGLGELRRALVGISTGRAPDARRDALARAHAAKLDRPIVDSDQAPDGLRVPLLGEAYVPPRCRVALLGQDARPADEEWWADQDVREDLADLLTSHLTAPAATRAPLLVLGQPGSGKSVLTRVLAAQLPAADFLVVRVALREVGVEADLQDQIEQAVRYETGERLEWTALVRSAGDALPVVLLDGFDELLQATGVTQTDYLRQVARFQRREAEQGRPVAVLVTTRTSVADRAKPPPETVALRLEPFDAHRVRRWVETWNRVNADRFPALGVRPLDPDVVLAHRELAEQPLLLLMLALYDAAGNDLRAAGALRRSELYEELLCSFACREVQKHRRGLTDRELARATEDELRRLAVVAFGMFNRGVQWVTQEDLESDLTALPFLAGRSPAARAEGGLRSPLRSAEILLGRFFFVHRSQATRDETRLATYEFLHATFGEFLVARTTALVLHDLTTVATASSLLPDVDDDPLHALLSFATLTGRAPVVTFLTERIQSWDADRRADATDVLLRLFRTVHDPRPPRRFDGYAPRPVSVLRRHAAYSANLLVLILCTAGEAQGGDLYPGAVEPRSPWSAQALLWRSQLAADEYDSLVGAVRLDRFARELGRDFLLRLGSAEPSPVDLRWTYDRATVRSLGHLALTIDPGVSDARRKANFECNFDGDNVQHALEPITTEIPDLFGVVLRTGSAFYSGAHAMLRMWLAPLRRRDNAEHREIYQAAVQASVAAVHPVRERSRLVTLLLDRLTTDPVVPVPVAGAVLRSVNAETTTWDVVSGCAFVRCCLAFLGREPATNRTLAELLLDFPSRMPVDTNPQFAVLMADAHVRLAELRLGTRAYSAYEYARLTPWLTGSRPDLVIRLRPLVTDDDSTPEREIPPVAGLRLPGADA